MFQNMNDTGTLQRLLTGFMAGVYPADLQSMLSELEAAITNGVVFDGVELTHSAAGTQIAITTNSFLVVYRRTATGWYRN